MKLIACMAAALALAGAASATEFWNGQEPHGCEALPVRSYTDSGRPRIDVGGKTVKLEQNEALLLCHRAVR